MAEHDKPEDFVSFDEALRELQMKREELRKLVSEGDLRAIKDGTSMKFRREEVERLAARRSDLELDGLEDDTGMVTEELTEEETLLAEDDLVEETKSPRAARTPPAKSRPARAAVEEEAREPGWATAAAILCAVVLVYGLMVVWGIASEQPPGGLTGMFAKK